MMILKLYELRRDPEMRVARRWFVAQFHPGSAAEIVQLLRSGFESSAAYRMVTTYWEMAAALVHHGGLDPELFQAANSEHVAVFCKLQPHLAEVRALIQEPDYLVGLERLVMAIPGVEVRLEKRRRLFRAWGEGREDPTRALPDPTRA
jgi:hypothetical protein